MSSSTILTLQDVAQARDFYAKGYWRNETLYMLLRNWAEKTPDKHAARDTNSRLTYRQLLEWVDAVAADLHAAGVREGERVAFWLPSRLESVIVFLACSRNGYVCNTSLHRDHTCADIIGLLKQAGTVALFAQPGYGADADKNDIFVAAKDLPQIKKLYRIDALKPDTSDEDLPVRFGDIRRNGLSSAPWRTDPDRVMYLAFTSGTTGQPKGVMHSDNTLMSNARQLAGDWGFGSDFIGYSLSPMSHNIGVVTLCMTLSVGAEIVIHTPVDAKRALDRLIETGGTFTCGVPTHGIDLLTEAKRRGLKKLGSLQVFMLGGAAVPPALMEALLEFDIRPCNGFGMTENCSFQYTHPGDPMDVVLNSCGRSAAGMEMRIFDQENPNVEVPVGTVGELACRGCSLMLGYFNNQTATENSFNKLGWFMTGDLGVSDAKGNVTIAGRKKDLIIRGGHNIHPAKIEDFIMRHPGVIKAAAFPVADERLGEKVCLAIIPHNAGALKGADMLRHLDENGLSKYEMPEYFLELDTFPLTPSGKVLKRRLVELVAQGSLKPEPIRFSK